MELFYVKYYTEISTCLKLFRASYKLSALVPDSHRVLNQEKKPEEVC